MSTEQFVSALTEYQLDPTEIAEIIWLALHLPEAASGNAPDFSEQDEPGGNATTNQDANEPREGMGQPPIDQDEGIDPELEENDDRSFGIAPELPAGKLPQKAVPISIPDPDILDDTLPLVRAMKPLLKQIESQILAIVNEVETVERIAETDIWSPVLNFDQEPWFDVALVIDGSPAMSIWQRLIQDIQRFLRCYGSFRDFRVWRLTATNGEVGICAAPDADAVTRSPRTLLPPDARRLILVFSDCTANYWWDGSLQPVLALWGKSTPTAVWQVLPDWMWKRTALGIGEYVAVRNHLPGATNPQLNPVFLSLRSSARRGRQPAHSGAAPDPSSLASAPICIPVVTSEEKSLGAWSQMLAGDRRYSTPGFMLPPTGWQPTAPSETTDVLADNGTDELLENFRVKATPAARRLAALLSAAPVITLPVMRLIRASDELLPGSSPLPIAEVFLGGLLQKAPDQPATTNPEQVQYIFPHEVRDRFLDILPKVDAVDVIEAVSRHVAALLNFTLADFRALLLSPDLKDEADRYGLRSFATMTAQILRRVGGFEDLVDQLEGASAPKDTDIDPERVEDDWLADFDLQPLTDEIAEYLNFPAITDFDFTEAELVEEADFSPPLQSDDFKIVTVELRPVGPSQER
ncbi:MAG: formylglycine-generating enzyme family protein, partial [Leptolyngbya sp. DLM2.Bin15]